MTNLKIKECIKTMTREEKIREASIDYQLSTNPRAIGCDAFADFAREMNVNQSFIAGVKWAEKQIIDRACEWLKYNLASFWQCKFYNDIEFIKDFKQAMEE